MREKILEIIEKIKPGAYVEGEGIRIRDILDSIEIVTLVDMVEEEFDIIIAGVCFQTENFNNVDSLIDMIERSK